MIFLGDFVSLVGIEVWVVKEEEAYHSLSRKEHDGRPAFAENASCTAAAIAE